MLSCRLLYAVIVLFNTLPRAHLTKLQEACASFNQSTSTRYSIYYHRSCYILDQSITGNWESWPLKCINFPRGHLAIIQSQSLLDKIILHLTRFGQAGGVDYCRIGLAKTNSTDGPTGNFHWYTSSGMYPVPHELIFWHSTGEPGGDGDCANLSSTWRAFYDYSCNPAYNLICQYPDPSPRQLRFKRVAKDASMQPQTVIEEHIVVNGHECATKCFDHPLCLSYSVNQATGNCRIHQVKTDFSYDGFVASMSDPGYQLWEVIIEE